MLAYNTSEHSTTKRTPFFINKEFKTNIFIKTKKCEKLVPHTQITVKKIYEL